TGIGIPPEIGDSIFTKFYSDHRKGVKQKPGFGIGMYLTKTFVDMLDGQISYESTLQVGTAFTITLPAKTDIFAYSDYPVGEDDATQTSVIHELLQEEDSALEEAESSTTTAPQKETEIVQTPSLLIVDDDKQLRDYLLQIFQDKYITYSAENGMEAL